MQEKQNYTIERQKWMSNQFMWKMFKTSSSFNEETYFTRELIITDRANRSVLQCAIK